MESVSVQRHSQAAYSRLLQAFIKVTLTRLEAKVKSKHSHFLTTQAITDGILLALVLKHSNEKTNNNLVLEHK